MDTVNATTDSSVSEKRPADGFRQEYAVALYLVRYVMIAFVVMGTIGNALSFVVLVSRRMRRTSINVYLALLACADTAVLYLSAFKTWLRVATGFELLHVSDAACKTTIFLFMLASHLSAWLVVLVTADRFVAVRFPLRAAVVSTPRRSALAAGLLFVVLAAYNAHLLWTVRLYELGPGAKQCVPDVSNAFLNGPFNYIRLASYTLVPFLVVGSLNVGIVVSVCRPPPAPLGPLADPEDSRTLKPDTIRKRQAKQHQLTVTLLVVSFSWLVLTMPYSTVPFFRIWLTSADRQPTAFLLKTVSFLLMYLNHSCNFLLYCIVGKKFRTELVSLFRGCCSRAKKPTGQR